MSDAHFEIKVLLRQAKHFGHPPALKKQQADRCPTRCPSTNEAVWRAVRALPRRPARWWPSVASMIGRWQTSP